MAVATAFVPSNMQISVIGVYITKPIYTPSVAGFRAISLTLFINAIGILKY